jgi:hypothetical protein
MSRYLEALQVWDWIQFRLPPALWLEAQQVLRSNNPPTPSDPQIAAGLAELLLPGTTNARRLELLQQLLTIIKNNAGSPEKP